MATITTPRLLTAEEYQGLDEVLGFRDELIEGQRLLSPSAIEVISPAERKARRLQKVGLYLDMGVPNVVEVDYKGRVVRVHTPEADSVIVYRQGDQITTPLRASLAEIFAILD